MSARNPRKDPLPGDMLEYKIGTSNLWGNFRVHKIEGGEVYYWDDGLLDHVPVERWRQWFVGARNVRVRAAK